MTCGRNEERIRLLRALLLSKFFHRGRQNFAKSQRLSGWRFHCAERASEGNVSVSGVTFVNQRLELMPSELVERYPVAFEWCSAE